MRLESVLRCAGHAAAAMAACLFGCAAYSIVPASLQAQLDRSLTFAQLKESPDSYRGRLVLVGGEVLDAKLSKQGTRLVVLQLPLEESQEPGLNRTASQGRFLAIQKDFLDPATVPEGTRVTIVGEVTGATTLPLDETDYAYPTLEIKHLKVWPGLIAWQTPSNSSSESTWEPYGGSYWGSPYGSYYYWGGPYNYWRIPRWGMIGSSCIGPCVYWQEGQRAKTWSPVRSKRKRRDH